MPTVMLCGKPVEVAWKPDSYADILDVERMHAFQDELFAADPAYCLAEARRYRDAFHNMAEWIAAQPGVRPPEPGWPLNADDLRTHFLKTATDQKEENTT